MTITNAPAAIRPPAWAGYGVTLQNATLGLDDALMAAGLDFTVAKRPVAVGFAGDINGVHEDGTFARDTDWTEYPRMAATVREDTNAILGIVGDGYQIVQNHEAFAFLGDLLNTDEFAVETAGLFNDGAKVWMLVKTPDYIEVGGDTVQPYVFVATSHDGSLAVTAAQTPVRIVCQNTLAMAISGAAQSYRVRHTGNADLAWDEARSVLGMTVNYSQQFKVLGDQLATKRVNDADVDIVLDRVFKPRKTDRAEDNRAMVLTTIKDVFAGRGAEGDTTGNAPGTAWCLLNAITEYSDFYRKVTVKTNMVQRAVEDNAIKQRALAVVRDYVAV